MKSWHLILLGLFIGMVSSAALFLIASPPRGTSVELLPAPTPAPIVVQVDGSVLKPGVYTLPRDSRAEQAVQAAGGFASNANPGAVNLAAPLKDGDKLFVPTQGTQAAPAPQAASEPAKPKEKSASVSEPAADPASPAGTINLNTATLEELQTLPGIGPTRAQQIIDYRNAHGGFKTVEELDNVSGIGPATLEKLKPYITVN